jgi:biopolymer transport protein ExbB
MKKLFLFLAVAAMTIGTAVAKPVKKATKDAAKAATEQVEKAAEAAPAAEAAAEAAPAAEAVNAEVALSGESLHYVLMQKFLEGGWGWMLPILVVLVLGMAIAIERILFLSLSTINTKKFIKDVEAALEQGGIEAAKDVCRNKRGPIASIFYQGLDRYHLGLDAVEKAVVSYGSVQTGRLESGLGWLSLFISLSPSLGFMGTVVGLVQSFDSIQAAGDISPALVAGGMKVALLTTLLGLIAAMVLQVFYNFVIVKIDGMVNEMEDASISLTDILTAYSKK